MIISSKQDVLEFLCADTQELAARHLYKDTDCGAWLEFEATAIRIGSIVEGCDFGTAIYKLTYPFSEEDFLARINALEDEASQLWEWANEETYFGTDPPDFDYEFETDGHSA